jgi:GAF domain-containing protein/multidrug resistance efflux pump
LHPRREPAPTPLSDPFISRHVTITSGALTGSDAAPRERSEHLRLLYESALAFGQSLDLDALLPLVLLRFRALLRADDAAIWLADGAVLRCRLTTGGEGGPDAGDENPLDGRSADESDAFALSAPLEAGGVTVGRIDLAAGPERGAFSPSDRALLADLTPLAGAALRNAGIHSGDSRAADLTLLLEISREITATLDLDRVLRSVVNLSARALTFDRAAVALYDKGICDIRAMAGQETVNGKDPKVLDLAARAAWVAGHGDSFYMVDREDPASDAERQLVQIFGQDLESDGVRSGLYLPLKDEEGTVGILLFESSQPEFATDMQREIAAILANQTAVALRNAQLYAQVPLVDTLGALAAKKRAFMELPKRRRQMYGAIALAILAALTLVRWPLRVSGSSPAFRPASLTEVRALVPGVIERVFVREGAPVARGAALVQLRDIELRGARVAAAAAVVAGDRAAALAASRSDPAEERSQRVRSETLRQQVALFDEELAAATIRAPAAGVVLTARPEERVGVHLDAGDLVVTIGRTDSLELEFGIDQREIGRVAVGNEVRLRVDALPQRTFIGRVTSLGPLPSDSAEQVRFPVRAAVANPDGLLRPGMAAYARVLTAPASVATRMARAPVRWLRLLWWRMWS